jgi:hypothetical protein
MQAPPARAVAGAHRPRLRQQGPLPRHLQYASINAHLLQFPSFSASICSSAAYTIYTYMRIHHHSVLLYICKASIPYTLGNCNAFIYHSVIRVALHCMHACMAWRSHGDRWRRRRVDRACMDPWWLAMDDGRTDGCMMQGKAGRGCHGRRVQRGALSVAIMHHSNFYLHMQAC